MSDDLTDSQSWLDNMLKSKMVDVWFRGRDGELFSERHVADPTTIFETVEMSIKRFPGKSAAFPYQGRWCVYTPRGGPREFRYYDTREAAEMVLIHNA